MPEKVCESEKRGRRRHFSMEEFAERILRETDDITAENIGDQVIEVRKGSCDRVSLVIEGVRAAIKAKDFDRLQSIRASLMWVEDDPGYPKPYARSLR